MALERHNGGFVSAELWTVLLDGSASKIGDYKPGANAGKIMPTSELDRAGNLFQILENNGSNVREVLSSRRPARRRWSIPRPA